MLEKLVEHIVTSLVSKPESVVISGVERDGKFVIQVRVAAEDVARVIGSEGRVFRAIRAVVMLLGNQQQRDVVVDIAE
jgi:predicted RNA-binding protein YlqC (UPF0109 family)